MEFEDVVFHGHKFKGNPEKKRWENEGKPKIFIYPPPEGKEGWRIEAPELGKINGVFGNGMGEDDLARRLSFGWAIALIRSVN